MIIVRSRKPSEAAYSAEAVAAKAGSAKEGLMYYVHLIESVSVARDAVS